jgi:glutathione peroxidase
MAINVSDVVVRTAAGEERRLGDWSGTVLLVVNVASRCGFTRQYAGLQKLQDSYGPRGFAVLGFPCNDFGSQEPGTAEQIQQFCTTKYSVAFPLFAKLQTKAGANQSPLYAMLGEATGKLPTWNFCKYVVGKDGKVVQFFGAGTKPDSKELRDAITKAMG